MTCKHCHGKLSPLRSLTDGEFCSDEHRFAFDRDHGLAASQPVTAEGASAAAEPQTVPHVHYEPVVTPGSQCDSAPALEPETEAVPVSARPSRKYNLTKSWRWLVTAWQTASLDLKALALLVPVLIALICSPAMHKLRLHFSTDSKGDSKGTDLRVRTRQALSERWKLLAQRISDRAAIAITDDFRSGLDFWQSRSNLTTSWSFDANGFVQPGPLAILKPTEDLTDYNFEFLGEIEHRGMGCAFRARDLDNYYAVKFIQDDSGSIPQIRLVRYAVIDGKEGPRVEKPLPSWIRADVMNRFRVDVHNGDFTILAQGEVVDFFSDNRLKSGGVGFFCARGEKARLRWVEVSHQYDTLGKVCAYLAPFSLAGVGKD